MEEELTQLAEHFNSKKVIIVSAIVLSLLIAGVISAYFLWPERGEVDKTTQDLNITTPTPEPTEEPIDDVLSGWKTYRNEELEFELKHPEHWHVDTLMVEENDELNTYNMVGEVIFKKTSSIGIPQASVYIKRYNTSLEKILKKVSIYLRLQTEPHEVVINNNKGYKMNRDNEQVIVIKKDVQTTFEIYASFPRDFQYIIDGILSTFKFIEP